MAQISKRKVSEVVLQRLFNLFFEVVGNNFSKGNFIKIISEVLTPTEKIMIAKRIGIIYLLIKEVDIRTIADKLKVSTSTVVMYSQIFNKNKGELRETIMALLGKEKLVGFLDDILVSIFIQPGIKKGHYQSWWEYKKRKEKGKVLGE